MTINIFIQARMSSSRFPGKVLAPFKGTPIIQRLIEVSRAVLGASKVVVLTSNLASDDPLVSYLDWLKVAYFRGDLNNVFLRFKEALKQYPCTHFVRLCADSPLIEPTLVEKMLELSNSTIDLTTNVHKRTFPKGLSVEVIKAETFLSIHDHEIDSVGKEHVTTPFYKNPEKYKIQTVESLLRYNENLCIDVVDDLKKLELQNDAYIFNPETLFVRPLG